MTSATQPTDHGPSRRTKILLGTLAALIIVGLAGGFYVNYRVNRFVDTTFRPDDTAPQTQFGETPTVPIVAQATVPPTPIPPTPDPRDPNTPAPPAATATSTVALAPTATALPYGNSPIIRRLKENQRINVLLIGFGGPGHDGGYLTDTLQVMSFEPKTGVVILISVPRDLWIQLPQYEGRGGYWGRINEAYTVGMGKVDRNDTNIPYSKHDAGGKLAMKAVSQVLGIPMDYWLSVDFVGFRRFIDAIGGVDVNVERAFTDTQYPNNDDADVDPSYRTIHFDAGWQHMNGERAIAFARSRYSPEDGSDFGRARRQQLLMSAVKDQIVSVETIPKLFGILDALEGHIRMSFSFSEAKDLLGWGQEQARAKRQFAISSGVIDGDRLLYGAISSGGASILLPRAGQGNYGQIQSWVRDLLGLNESPDLLGTPGTPRLPGVPGVRPTATR
ncbi:MAG: hypothetical protein AVDCRST_MAG18-2997 [uncultured Thermomicrobiales bacterium]|uniref:Cell envelope-related transcriptional attenuator domain-containing protein n=1 Tax=uncultured Thermomicrobiales bacterium TaxID=1645740 RepID=A0A6J4VJS9_9BACT|nr:MAG: hypothetical protein AVDCRST_MAG18-2997 [uncultured Thermomicrobiales bacterium]